MQALNHPWFEEVPLAKDMALMPTFPSRGSAAKKPHLVKSPDPLEEQRRREELAGAMGGGGGLFSFAP